ncbi:HEAT repeat domain-containing protein [Hazenella sp. IB182357]|uniref:HEAT repeat domain-containing protein n=1 Tax=Polycladospora coralii TaxID=2771432 RepID=A0A926N6U1_9BACL|nr:HEAT repeat domain-containing protein [Polycladospora coralii]MBD1370776.1 HEAT repeat domain-containing protein [Polycladospora coralii]MBS7529714.1 HEAT repeat domain-containing protein [Polycladospora coralii]
MSQHTDLYDLLVRLAHKKEKSRTRVADRFAERSRDEQIKAIHMAQQALDPQVRRVGYAILGEMGDSIFIHEAVKGLHDKRTDVIQMAVWALGKMKHKEALPHLLRLWHEGHGFKVVKTIVWAVGEIGDPTMVPELAKELDGASARLCEGVLVSGIKMGHAAFITLIRSLVHERAEVQSALRDASFASRTIRSAIIRSIQETKEREVLADILAVFPYITLERRDYQRLLQDKRETVRIVVYQSIHHAALERKYKQRLLMQALDDESNRVVKVGLTYLSEYLSYVSVRRHVEQISNNHLSPQVRAEAKHHMQVYDKVRTLQASVCYWDRFLLKTLPGIEHFVIREAKHFGIALQIEQMGKGWLAIHLKEEGIQLEAFKWMHTISRICGIVSIHRHATQIEHNPYIQRDTDIRLESVYIGDDRYEVVTVLAEGEMHRPSRKIRSTSLDWRVARTMVLCSDPKPDDVIVDPTCGSGSLLLDRISWGDYKGIVGGDRDEKAIQVATQNLRTYSSVNLYQWDASQMGVDDDSATVVMANLPFGRRVGNHEENIALYPQLVREIVRILHAGGRAVLLTQEVKLLHEALKPYRKQLVCEWEQAIEMGGLTPHILRLRKC